jgi:threonylcarbamoyladenosine tRNA methylthiotransferase MtaB
MSKIITTNETLSPLKAHLYVLGCKVNQAEIYSISNMLESLGLKVDQQSQHPALIFVNTCCVTDSAAGKSRRLVGRLAEKYPDSKIVVAGCLAEINPTMVNQAAPGAIVLGTYAKDHLLEILSGRNTDVDFLNSIPASSCSEFSAAWVPAPSFRSRAFLKVQDGCSHRCSYCIVPIARGPSRSMELRKAVENAKFLVDAGYSEIALTGIHLGAYGRDLSPKTGLENLVEEILAGASDCRLRLSSIEPQEFSDRLISLIKQNSRICKHFHIPAQSGDDEILKRMFRPYNKELVAELTGKILESAPDACVGMDVMVGFPGETDASFEKTVEFIMTTGCGYLHVFPFSPRRGTVAYGFSDRTPARSSRYRVEILRKLSNELRSKFYGKFVGRTLHALVEYAGQSKDEWGKGLTGNYISVQIKGLDKTHEGKVVPVKIDAVRNNKAYGLLTFE